MTEERTRMLGEGKVLNVLVKLAVPGIIAMVISAIYNIIDAFFVGMLDDTNAIAAVSVAFPIFILIAAIGQMFGVGSASYISRLLGEKNVERAEETASTTFYTALIISLLFIVFGCIFIEPLLSVFGATKELIPYANEYAVVLMLGSTFTILNMTMNNMIRAEGNPKYSMIAISIGAVANIILDPIIMFGFGMGLKGAAIATVIGQGISTVYLLSYYITGKSLFRLIISKMKPSIKLYSQIMKIGIASFVRQALSSLAIGMLNSAAKEFGVSAVAAMGLTLRVFVLPMYVIMGFCQGFQPLAGYNYGAKKFKRLREIIGYTIKITSVLCCIASLIFMLFARPIVGCFTADASVIDIGTKTLRAMSIMLPLFGFQISYATLYQALGKGKESMILSFARQGFFFIPLIIVLPRIFGLNGVIFTQTIADLLTIVITFIFSLNINKEIKKYELKERDEFVVI